MEFQDIYTKQNLKQFMKLTVFDQMRALNAKYNAIDIGLGQTDYAPPAILTKKLNEAIDSGLYDQYAPVGGNALLKKKVAEIFTPILNFEIDASTQVLITLGALGGLQNSCTAFLDKDDEVILFDPHFYGHNAMPMVWGGVSKPVPLIAPSKNETFWSIDFERFEQAFTAKTKLLFLSSPNNPTGKIFTAEEYERIAQIVDRHPRVLVVCDDVYFFLLYGSNPKKFARFTDALEGRLRERTVTLGSFGKLFGVTGYRLGYAIGAPRLIKAMSGADQNLYYTMFHPLQPALAEAITSLMTEPYENAPNFLAYTQDKFNQNRLRIVRLFETSFEGVRALFSEGGYFQLFSIRDYVPKIKRKYFYKEDSSRTDLEQECSVPYELLEAPDTTPDLAFVRFVCIEKSIAVLPASDFYADQEAKQKQGIFLVRVALCKKSTTYDAIEQNWKIKH